MSNLVRLAALFLSFAFGIIGLGLGINSSVEESDTKDFVRANAPPGVTVDIDTSEANSPGAVLTVGCGLLALTSSLTFLLILFRPYWRKAYLSAAYLHFFFTVWIFATLVAFDVIAVNRSAKVAAFLGGTQLPDSIVQQQQQTLGVSSKYWDFDYIKNLAIVPWFAFLFGGIAGFVLLRTVPSRAQQQRDYDRGLSTAARDADVREVDEGKPSVEKHESV